MYELAIIGNGGFAKEVRAWAASSQLSQLDSERSLALIAIGSPAAKRDITSRIRHGQGLVQLIHNTAINESKSVESDGLIMCPYSIITVNCKIGKHVHLNLHSDIGHDCVIGDYVTLAPSARVSGNCTIGDRVYIGSNAVIREGVTIAPWSVIGAGAVVLNDITESGTYVGNPVRKVK